LFFRHYPFIYFVESYYAAVSDCLVSPLHTFTQNFLYPEDLLLLSALLRIATAKKLYVGNHQPEHGFFRVLSCIISCLPVSG